ncbi:MAG TPA: TAXI family TRAP transporter solute-binding subunit [Methylomirabilota bacterium]
MKSRFTLWTLAVVLTIAVLWVSLFVMDPFPPRRIVVATGQPDGTYDALGREYQRRLRREGLTVELRRTAGSVENLDLLRRGGVDVAFVQGGIYQPAEDPQQRLRGMAAIYREPLWIFYRGKPIGDGLASLAGRRLSIGAPGSGTEAVARALFDALGLSTGGANVVRLTSAEARRALEEDRIDAAFFVASYADVNVVALLHRPDVHLLGFTRDVAFARNFRYLTPVRLDQGLLDLKVDLPRQEVTLMAPAALLLCRESLHPRVVEQILTIARDVHGAGSLIDAPGRFPTREGVDVPLHDAADSFLSRGESLLSRVLPYWALRWFLQMRLLLLPLFAVWVPLFGIMPMLLNWRGNRVLQQLYAALRDAEAEVATAGGEAALRDVIVRIEALRKRIEALTQRLPLKHQRDLYHCRLHVSLVLAEARERLTRMVQQPF